MNHGNGNGYYIDIGACFHQDYLAYRRVASGTDSGWFRILDEKSGLMKSGDTMTGELALLGNRYTYGTDGKCGLNANNSDIAKVNAIYFADASDSIGEGINFWRTESTWDNMTASNGTFYFGSNVSANATLVGNAYLRAAQYTATDANGFRHAYGDTGYGVFTRNDASHFYLMLTNEGDPLGSWNSLHPLAIKLSDGSISFGTACTFGSSLTASTVSIWNSSHAPLTIGRSGSTYYASIKFANSLGTLGYLGMTAVDGALCKGNSTASDFYALLDASNWSTYCMSKNPAYIEFSPSSTGNYGGYLDFHYNNSSADYTSRIIEDASGQLTINGVHFKSSQIIAGSYAVPRVKAWDGSTLTLVP